MRDRRASPADFLAARPVTREKVFAEPSPVPEEPGVQGWWFRTIPGAIDTSGCEQRDGLTLLYVGISPRGRRPTGSRRASRICASASATTTAQATRTPRDRRCARRSASYSVTSWVSGCAASARVPAAASPVGRRSSPIGWPRTPSYRGWSTKSRGSSREQLVATLDLPLNLQPENKDNAFFPELKRLRRQAEVTANKQRILKEW